MKIDGGCHCGFITYEAQIDPAKVIVCHCTDCQILSGSAFRTIAFVDAARFRLLSGEPKTYVKTAASGARRAQVFCGQCGTHIYGTSVEDAPEVLGLRVGTARQRAALRPVKQQWCGSALDWVADLDAVERVD